MMVRDVQGENDLQRKYRELIQKYEQLVHKYEGGLIERMAISQLSNWAMRSSEAALVMLREGKVVASNARWHQLVKPHQGAGKWGREGSSREPVILETLVAAEARGLAKSGKKALVLRAHRGESQVVELRLERLDMAGHPLVAVMAIDVTERVEREREMARARELLEAQERMRVMGELASGVAHDLNNTLNAIALRVGMLADDPTCDRSQRENLETLGRILSDAGEMVGRVQDFARQRHDRPTETLHLGVVIGQAIEMIRPQLEKLKLAGTRVNIQLQLDELPPVPGRAEELRHVFLNVLLNARDSMPRGGRIIVRGHDTPSGVEVSVADEGTGIPADHIDKVFNPFFTTKGRRGTGLGLSMAYGVMTRLGGSISAANRRDQGAVITMRFPHGEGQALPPRLAEGEPAPAAAADGQPVARVLVIDDDRENLEAMKAVIEAEGPRVETAASGEEALALLKRGGRFDLVLCDVGMPEMSGWEVANHIRELAPGTRVVLITGWAREIPENDPRRAIVAGVEPKPLEIGRIRRLLAPTPAEAAHP
jgi:signal transduction histidine kinase